MPRNYKLTWQAGTKGRGGRWRKKYLGRVYYFDGGNGKTDRDAYQTALTDWEHLKIKLDTEAPKPHQEAYDREITRWESVLSWSNKYGEAEMAETSAAKLLELRQRLQATKPSPIRLEDTFDGQFELAVRNPKLVQSYRDFWANIDEHNKERDASSNGAHDHAPGADDSKIDNIAKPVRTVIVPDTSVFESDPVKVEKAIWNDRLDVVQRTAGPTDTTYKAQLEIYLTHKRSDLTAGKLSAGRFAKLKSQLTHFQDWLGADTDVTEISGKRLVDYRANLLAKVESGEWASTTANNRMVTVKSFVRWLWQMDAIPTLPRVLDGQSKTLEISKSRKPIETFEIGEIKTLLSQASDRTRLYLLLMLNCGMTQKDISDLHFDEVDWQQNSITRKRSKTKRYENVPVVKYSLWPETAQLLKQEKNPANEGRVLVNSNGDPICREELAQDDKYKKNDNVKNAFDRLKKKTGIEKPLKSLKKTSASLIAGHKSFNGLEDLFLGHAPQRMSDKHYAKPPQDLLDEAIAWLSGKYEIGKFLDEKGIPKTETE